MYYSHCYNYGITLHLLIDLMFDKKIFLLNIFLVLNLLSSLNIFIFIYKF